MQYGHFYRYFGILGALFLVGFIFGQYLIGGAHPTLASFALVHFLGYLFFLLMPVEVLIPIYLGHGFSPWLVGIIAILTAIAGLIIDYFIGKLFPSRILEELVGKERFKKYKAQLEKYGRYVVLFFGATPLSSPILTLVAGIIRFNPLVLLVYTVVGVTIKYAVLVLLFQLF